MDAKDLDYYKNKLMQKQVSLTDMVHRTEGYGREKEQNTQDIGDMAVESYTKEFMFGKSAGDECRGDNGKRHLEGDEDGFRNGTR